MAEPLDAEKERFATGDNWQRLTLVTVVVETLPRPALRANGAFLMYDPNQFQRIRLH